MESERYPAPPPPPMTGANPDSRHRAAPTTANHRPSSISYSLAESALPQPEELCHTEPPPGPSKKLFALEKPPPPRFPKVDSHESLSGSQSMVFTHCSPNADPNSAFVPTHSAKGDSERVKGLEDKGQGAVHHLSTSNPQPDFSPPASSHRPSELATMEGQRSPSPQFFPQRLSDKPPASLQDEHSNRYTFFGLLRFALLQAETSSSACCVPLLLVQRSLLMVTAFVESTCECDQVTVN